MADFEGEFFGFSESLDLDLPRLVKAYPVCLTSLSKIAELIIEKSQQASEPSQKLPELCDGMIKVWEGGLMELLQLDHLDTSDTVWPNMIHIAVW